MEVDLLKTEHNVTSNNLYLLMLQCDQRFIFTEISETSPTGRVMYRIQ